MRLSALALIFALACARPASVVQPADNLSSLASAVRASRARLDSVVSEIHRIAGDSTSSSIRRSQRLRASSEKLDSSYRANLVELLTAMDASVAGLSTNSARFPGTKADSPFVRAFADGANWMLQSPLIYQIGDNPAAIIIVPRGFVTDFASVPQPLKALQSLVTSVDRYEVPSLVHDYLYWRQDCTREEADDIMELALKKAGVSLLERKVVHEGLTQFGQAAWDANRQARESGLIRTVGAPYDQIPLTTTWPDYRAWLQTQHASAGVEYAIPRSVCSAAGSDR